MRKAELPTAGTAVELRRVHKKYGDVVAVREVDLTVARGEFYGVVGPSGAGKSTVLKLIGGSEWATSGEVRVNGQDVTDVPAYRRPVRTVWQDRSLFPHMTVAEQVAYPLRMRRVRQEEMTARVELVLEKMGLAGLGSRRPDQLSGGQQQRVALARALVDDDQEIVVLLDEPLGHLDARLRLELRDFLAELHRELGRTFVLVTHDQAEALSLSTRLAVMRDGEILQTGRPDEIYFRPKNRFVAEFMGEINIFVGGLKMDGVFATDCGLALPVPEAHRGMESGLYGIRPEHIELRPMLRGTSTLVRGRVVDRALLGPETRVWVELDRGHQRVLAVGGARAFGELQPGQEVGLTWDTNDAILLEE